MQEDTSKDSTCQDNKFIRPLYFHGMLLDEKDFTVEQSYHIEKRKLFNRTLHGWGIVCGLDIQKKNETDLTIEPGMALDCHGNEIWVPEPMKVDLREISFPTSNDPQNSDPAECMENTAAPDEFSIAIRYNEKSTTPVPTYMATSDCDKSTCHFSRTQEGFCIKFLTESEAEKHQKASLVINLWNERLFHSKQDAEHSEGSKPNLSDNATSPKQMLACPEVHYVILGKIKVDRSKKKVIKNHITQGRTYINSFKIFSQLMDKIKELEKKIQGLSQRIVELHQPVKGNETGHRNGQDNP